MKILSLSDVQVPLIHSPRVRERFGDVDLVLGCGDLEYEYMEFVISMLDVPLFYVRGNHSKEIEYGSGPPLDSPSGGVGLHTRVAVYRGLIMAGVEGSLRYHPGPYQYTQSEMWLNVIRLVPKLILNRVRYGRALDIFVTHAPPWKIHDEPDHAHQGIKAFRWLIRTFKPAYNFHGHIHIYHPKTIRETIFGDTRVINTFGYRVTDIQLPLSRINGKLK
jgi:uncharacterized protein